MPSLITLITKSYFHISHCKNITYYTLIIFSITFHTESHNAKLVNKILCISLALMKAMQILCKANT